MTSMCVCVCVCVQLQDFVKNNFISEGTLIVGVGESVRVWLGRFQEGA